MDIFLGLLRGGLAELAEYLLAHFMTCLVPAFFIAGGISTFISQGSILRYFGHGANKWLSYGVASVSGTVLSVCSCTVLPLFAGIYRRGAGLGPAIAFLYSGPAINVLAIIWTARILGSDIGVARAIGAVLFALVIGFLMAKIFYSEERERAGKAFALTPSTSSLKGWQAAILFVILIGILVSLAWGIKIMPEKNHETWRLITGISIKINWIACLVAGLSIPAFVVVLRRWLTGEETSGWLRSTWSFFKMILPWLLGGIFAAGMIGVVLPHEQVAHVVGGNSLLSNFIASLAGALFYFATLTEVPILKTFTDAGMGTGPALALLLAGPALSLPNMLVLRGIMGVRKTLTYAGLTVVMASICGFIFGLLM
ncbi:permease [Candidatus Aerophobetes bacterium]|uniref:Permease n=1 Tax=Aerophobetes bacterium TaxID=2030807 RepID=A0A523W074_UNCAE|nr:MAG: permease [Candidatus Aerophobetes bacterium]